jgi:hypothetical protein
LSSDHVCSPHSAIHGIEHHPNHGGILAANAARPDRIGIEAKRQAERAKRQQQIEQGENQEAPIMAFGGDEPRRSGGFGLFGN